VRVLHNDRPSDEAVTAAVAEVNRLMWSHPAYPLQLRWEWTGAGDQS
jgi:hypothetical protein